jgi:hypothetical protein
VEGRRSGNLEGVSCMRKQIFKNGLKIAGSTAHLSFEGWRETPNQRQPNFHA